MGELKGWKYCPRCRGELRLDSETRAECAECGFAAYASSKPTASAVVVDDEGRVLMGRRGIEPFKNHWDLPGGFLEEGEHPLDALRRELREETGLDVEPVEFLGAWMDSYGGDSDAEATLNLHWLARVRGGTPEAADDVSELRWFRSDALPPYDEIAFSHIGEVLERALARLARDEQP